MDFVELNFENINNLITIRNTKYNKIFNIDNECIFIDNKIKDDIISFEKYLIINNIQNKYVKKNIMYYKNLYFNIINNYNTIY
jgi:hypothetical protein